MTQTEDSREKTTDNGEHVVNEIRRALRGLVVATIILFVALAGIACYSYITSNNNRIAVCRLAEDLQRRIDSSKDFLIKHPNGLPGFAITRAQIVKEIQNQERTREALSVVSC